MRKFWTCCVLAVVLSLPGAASSNEAEERYAEEVVRALYFEGMPYATGAAISEAGAARLVEMLGDPSERPHQLNILTALGMSGHSGSFEALVAFWQRVRSGEIERPDFRAWRVVPIAMGHLARSEPRAIVWLGDELNDDSQAPWTFQRRDPRRVRHEACIQGLGVSGVDDAEVLLNDLLARRSPRSARATTTSDDPSLRRIAAALALHARVSRDGPASVGAQEGGR